MVAFVITPLTQSVTEGGALRFRISIVNPNYSAIGSYKIYWRTNGTQEHAANSADYEAISGLRELIFSASGPQFFEFTLNTFSDNRIEGIETFSVDLYDYQQKWLGEEDVFTIQDAVAALQIDELKPINGTVVAGTEARVTAVIRNVGNKASGAFDSRIYLSRDAFVSADDTVLATFSSAPLAVNGTKTFDDFNVPFNHGLALEPGTYYLLVKADIDDDVLEVNNNDNVWQRVITIAAPPPTLSIAAASADKNEGNSGTTAFTFTVSRGGSISSSASVAWSIGTNQSPAADSNDFSGATGGTLSWSANDGASKTITVLVRGDTTYEGGGLPEHFQVNLSNASGATIVQGSASAHVRNDDPAPQGSSISISALSADKPEGNSGTTSFTFSVTRSGDASSAASATWTVGAGDSPGATNSDFLATSGTVSWSAGDSSAKTITVNVLGDTAYESSGVAENFVVTLSNGVGTSIAMSSAAGRIQNDDPAPPTTNVLAASSLSIADPNRLVPTEIVDLAQANVGQLWGPTDCTDFVWAISNLAGAPFFDDRSNNLIGGDPLRPNPHLDDNPPGYIVPHHSNLSRAAPNWERVNIPPSYLTPSSEAGVAVSEGELRRTLMPGDLVRVYTDGDEDEGHSFIVTGRSNNGVGAPTITVVDNVDGIAGNSDNRIAEHDLFEYAFIDEYVDDAARIYIFRLAGSWSLAGDSGDDVLEGGNGDDVLAGGSGADLLIGGGGDDHVAAEAGTDTIIAGEGAGDDIYDGGGDIDWIVFSSAIENLLINLATGVALGAETGLDQITAVENVLGGAGDDRIVGGPGANVLQGGPGDDHVYGYLEDSLTSTVYSDGPDTLEGGDGADTLRGSGGSDTLIGGAGDDTLGGRGGVDLLDGGPGDDIGLITRIHLSTPYAFDFSMGSGGDVTEPEGARFLAVERLQFVGGTGPENVVGGASIDLIDGRDGNDILNGSGGGDYVLGGAGDDVLYGGDDHDWIEGNTGNDTIDGGAGFDFASLDFRDRATGLTFALGSASTLSIAYIGGVAASSVVAIEEVEVFGTSFDDFVQGGSEYDWLEGGGGNDRLYGNGDGDFIFGGDGNDVITGNDGNDSLGGWSGFDWMEGGAGIDWLSGGDGDDRLEGGAGNDTLDGQAGWDTMYGGLGDDVYYVDNAGDDPRENSGEGFDIVFTSVTWAIRPNIETVFLAPGAGGIIAFGDGVANVLVGNEVANVIAAYGGNDWIEGRGGNDWLEGWQGDDRIEGGDGADRLDGGQGSDVLIGGANTDTFVYNAISDSSVASYDSIRDFQIGVDKVNLTAVRTNGADGFHFVYAYGNTYLFVDIGGGGDDMLIELTGTPGVTASDLIWN